MDTCLYGDCPSGHVIVDTWLYGDCPSLQATWHACKKHTREHTFFLVFPIFPSLFLLHYCISSFLFFYFSFSTANSYFSSKSVYFLSFVNILFHHHEHLHSLGTRCTCKVRNTRAGIKLRNMFLYSFFISFCSSCLSHSLSPSHTHTNIFAGIHASSRPYT